MGTRKAGGRGAVAGLAALFCLQFVVPVVAAARPSAHDYLATAGLSQPTHATRRELLSVGMRDGTALHVEVVRPVDAGRYPVILEASPYHGTIADRDGTRILPGPTDPRTGAPLGLTGYFGPRGYVVVMVDLRGTGQSSGCLDHLGPADASDLKEVIEWAASQRWSSGRVGMAGHSYVAASQIVAAAQRPRGLVTIVPSAGLASMYDHQFQAGVPYNLQWAGPMFAYEDLAFERSVPATGVDNPVLGGKIGYGDYVGHNPQETGCGAKSSSLTAGDAQLSGQYVDWDRQRDYRAAATAAPIPIFAVHSVNDDAARVAAMEWFTARGERSGDKLWLGQWSHGVGCCPNRRGAQWTAALHAWFDRQLKQLPVDTGPPVEVFLSDGSLAQERDGARAEVVEPAAWPPPQRTLVLNAETGNRLIAGASTAQGVASFAADVLTGGSVRFTTDRLATDVLLAGLPTMTLVASVTVPRVDLIANVYDVQPDGSTTRITQFAINPELRGGIDTVQPVVPGAVYVLHPPGFTVAHLVRAGHRLALDVATTDPDKVPTFANDPNISIMVGVGGTSVRLPVMERPALLADDVPL